LLLVENSSNPQVLSPQNPESHYIFKEQKGYETPAFLNAVFVLLQLFLLLQLLLHDGLQFLRNQGFDTRMIPLGN